MIASLRGIVESVSTQSAVISVGGVGFCVIATPNTLSQLQQGSETYVHTCLVVKEDALSLFAFSSSDEKHVFEILLKVSGIGARTAIAILSVLPPEELRRALANKDERALTRVPGIGKKGAQRMILEIGDKLGPSSAQPYEQTNSVSSPSPARAESDVLEALMNLGWQEKSASQAIAAACEQAGSAELTVAQLLRSSLQILGKTR